MTRGIPSALAVLAVVLSSRAAHANCYPPKSFSQIGLQYSQYVLSPPHAEATPQSFIGRFWQPGLRVSTHEGSCDETRWFPRCYDCTPDHEGPVYYIDGTLGDMPCFSGCPQGEIVVLLQDRSSQGGGIFALGRVTEIPGGVPRFDFSRIEEDWRLIPIPRPLVSVSEVEGTTLRLGVTFSDPGLAYFGLPNGHPSETIAAIHLMTWVGISPPVERSAWTSIGRFAYHGGITVGSANVFGACPDSEVEIRFIAGALEIDDGELLTDYVSAAVPVSCTAELPAGAGHLAESGSGALTVARSAGELTLAWGPACFPPSPTFEVYEGLIGSWELPTPISCAEAGPTMTFPEPADSTFYLVVPYANRVRPPQVEGSYGRRGDGAERPPSPSACRPQWIVSCP